MSDDKPLGTVFRSGSWEAVRSSLADLSPRQVCTLFASQESDLTAYRNSQVLVMERLDMVGQELVETRERLRKEEGNVAELLRRMGNSADEHWKVRDEHKREINRLRADLKREHELRLELAVKLGVEVGDE